MNKKIIKKSFVFTICLLFIGTSIVSMVSGDIQTNEKQIMSEIEKIQNKLQVVDEIIGARYVQYWEHVIDEYQIKNDYILVHSDIETGEILKYEKRWTEIECPLSNCEDITFKSEDYFWKQKVVFPDESDCNDFYTFCHTQEYPLACWEIRYTDGVTIMYDLEGEQIGQGIPAPFNGFSLSGFHEESWPDPWLDWRLNADSWYIKWCDSTVSISQPTPSTISSYVSNSEYSLFYELAHGGSTYFQADWYGSYYTSSDVTNDLSSRDPMRFAFIGSCGGMDDTGPGTWSYEFRKGQITDTVTVGYTGMASCPGWSVSLPWQDMMFSAMDEECTIKDAFDLASANYPTIADCVVFVGDTELKITDDNGGGGGNGSGNIPPKVTITYPQRGSNVSGTIDITGTAYDIDGSIKHVYVQIDSNGWQLADGTLSWNYIWDTTQVEDGEHVITAISYDGQDYSGCVSNAILVENEEEPEEKYPDLTCGGSLSWTDIRPKVAVSGEFTIANIGDAESELDWEITETPSWGDWTFNPVEGYDLTPEDGVFTVGVIVVAPDESDQSFTGEIKIVNKNDSSDFEIISVSLATPKDKEMHRNQLFLRFLEDHPRLFPVLRHLLELW